jgi:hypothetical protein
MKNHALGPARAFPLRFALACLCAVLSAAVARERTATVNPTSSSTPAGIEAAQQEKAARTGAQKKLDSQIVLALKKSRGEPPFDKPTTLQPDLTIQPDGRVLVDLQATVSPALLQQIGSAGGEVVNSFEAARAVRARIPLQQLEAVAARPDVTFIAPAGEATTNPTPNPRAPQSSSIKPSSQ